MPDDHHNDFGPSPEPSREIGHTLRKQAVGLHSDTPVILLTIVPPGVAQMVKGQHRKLCSECRWRPADIATMFNPLTVQVCNDHRNGGIAEKSHSRLERARERRYHDQIDRNFRSRLSSRSNLFNADLG